VSTEEREVSTAVTSVRGGGSELLEDEKKGAGVIDAGAPQRT